MQRYLRDSTLVTTRNRKEQEYRNKLRASGWWSLKSAKIQQSRADYWVFVLQGFANKSVDFAVVPPQELLNRLRKIHSGQHRIWQVYLSVTKEGGCWETRNLSNEDKRLIEKDKFSNPNRNFRKFLNVWDPVERLNES